MTAVRLWLLPLYCILENQTLNFRTRVGVAQCKQALFNSIFNNLANELCGLY